MNILSTFSLKSWQKFICYDKSCYVCIVCRTVIVAHLLGWFSFFYFHLKSMNFTSNCLDLVSDRSIEICELRHSCLPPCGRILQAPKAYEDIFLACQCIVVQVILWTTFFHQYLASRTDKSQIMSSPEGLSTLPVWMAKAPLKSWCWKLMQ